jgi:head-tail adaptor
MSLLESAYEDFTIVNKAIVDDGYGGTTTTWSDGATIKGAMVHRNSTLTEIAQALGAKATYTFTVKKSVLLDFHTVLRRESDKKIFRLTDDADDNKTPNSAGLDMRQYSAEEWQLNG